MTYSLDDMPNLNESLGKYQHEAIKYEPLENPSKRGTKIINTVLNDMQGRTPSDTFCGANDIIAGVCRLDHYNQKDRNIPLSQNRVYNILKCMEVISTEEIQHMMGVGERQARYYMKAVKTLIPLLEKHFETCEDGAQGGIDLMDFLDSVE